MEFVNGGNKRYLKSAGHDVEFYLWGDATTPAIKVSVVKIKKRWLGSRIVKLYSESHHRDYILDYQATADRVVANYLKELAKMEAFK